MQEHYTDGLDSLWETCITICSGVKSCTLIGPLGNDYWMKFDLKTPVYNQQ